MDSPTPNEKPIKDHQPHDIESPRELSDSSSVTASSATATDHNSQHHDAFGTRLHDVESNRSTSASKKNSFFGVVFDQAGITNEVINHPYQGDGTPEDPYQVDFLPQDPRNGMTFKPGYKWTITLLEAFATLAVSFTSSVYSGAVESIMIDFQPSEEVAILGVSMFVLGFAIGPLIWAPFSELYGRQKLLFITYMALTAFNAGSAGAPNMAALVILRFFAGAFGSSPLTNAGGVIADIFSANERGIATSIFAMAPFLGPALGPIAGGFLSDAAGWRWVMGLAAAFTGLLWIICGILIPETYAPVLLRQRADALSKRTGKSYISKLEVGKPKQTLGQKLKVSLSRPWVLLFKEPIVLLTSIYMAIIYGTLYLCFAAFPIVYQQGRGWNAGVGGLSFCGIAVGMTLSTIGTIYDNKRYSKISAAHNGFAPPEARLPPSILGSVLIPVGLFWFAWTNGSNIHWIVSIIGSGVFAAGIVLVFLSLMNYLIDTCKSFHRSIRIALAKKLTQPSDVIYAASVLAANSVLRSLFGAIFPLFTSYMYKDLGIHWASSIPAFLALACLPFPFLFYKYGATIRMKCKYAADAANFLQKVRSAVEEPPMEDPSPELQRTMTEKSAASNVVPT